MTLRAVIRVARLALSAVLLSGMAMLAETAPAEADLLAGRVGDAEDLLNADLRVHPGATRDHLLLCRVFYAQNRSEEAQRECEAAAIVPNSETELWLGRVFGARASAAGPLQAFTLARKVHKAFEQAVHLDQNNVAAMSDLGEFYVDAPAIVGGGLEKARALISPLTAHNAVAAHHLGGLIAQKDGDVSAAEREFEAAAASGTAAGLIDLALFRLQHNQPESALDAVHLAIAADHLHDASLVDAASLLTTLKREPRLAAQALREYLASSAVSDAAPTFKVHLQLAAILRALGDTAGAERETEAAIKLAPAYASAHKLQAEAVD